ncbi:MAG: outer membrane beta-barrel protein [Elusimicrobia bacterium]|nr:outer membrane beta-barrel protein [Elusimicrobiota bacterium]
MKRTILLLAAALACPAAAAAAGTLPEPGARSVSLTLDGSFDKYGNTRSEDLRAGLEFECASALKLGRSALDWNVEFYYSYSRSVTDGRPTKAVSEGLDLAKLLLSGWGGEELGTVKPYLLAGVELTWLKEPDEEEPGRYISSRFLSPTAGAGVEVKLNHRLSLSAEYRQNLTGGDRRISGMTLGLNYAIFGAEEEEGTSPGNGPDD